jgi:hypothetical protein
MSGLRGGASGKRFGPYRSMRCEASVVSRPVEPASSSLNIVSCAWACQIRVDADKEELRLFDLDIVVNVLPFPNADNDLLNVTPVHNPKRWMDKIAQRCPRKADGHRGYCGRKPTRILRFSHSIHYLPLLSP